MNGPYKHISAYAERAGLWLVTVEGQLDGVTHQHTTHVDADDEAGAFLGMIPKADALNGLPS